MAKSITLTRSYPHPPEKVWKTISNSEALASWLMPNNFKLEVGHRFYFQKK
ncbi:MAG: SRPBCC domain-containing protein [Cyclobacteriaceae bacterium]|nr:SRPBCC domain-containing protein [Cyclobacteriaceae bacterium]